MSLFRRRRRRLDPTSDPVPAPHASADDRLGPTSDPVPAPHASADDRLDAAIAELEVVVAQVKAANEARETREGRT